MGILTAWGNMTQQENNTDCYQCADCIEYGQCDVGSLLENKVFSEIYDSDLIPHDEYKIIWYTMMDRITKTCKKFKRS